MSGHSHWSTIKHKKAAADAKRGKLFSMLTKAIIVAAKTGGGDPSMNLALRYAIDKALAANMTKDAIARAIKKGTGELSGVSYEEITYEAYGPGGVAVLVETLTDNRNRTGAQIRKIFEVRGGNLAGVNAVAWNFHKKGLITVSAAKTDEDSLMEIVLEAGADDLTESEGVFEITCQPPDFEAVRKAITDAGVEPDTAEVTMLPNQTVTVDSASAAKKILDLMNTLDDHDDVQNVYANFEIAEDVMAALQT